jgi:hypothetical protein
MNNSKFGFGKIILTRGNVDYVDFGVQNKVLDSDEITNEVIVWQGDYVECSDKLRPIIFNKKIYGNTKDVRGKWNFEYKKIYFGKGKVSGFSVVTGKKVEIERDIGTTFKALRKIIRIQEVN